MYNCGHSACIYEFDQAEEQGVGEDKAEPDQKQSVSLLYNRTHNDTGLDRFVQVQVPFVSTYIQRTTEYDLDRTENAKEMRI